MLSFGSGATKKPKISKHLCVVMENSCPQCHSIFDQNDFAPHILFPCQHIFCEKCIAHQILKGEQSGICKQCSKAVQSQNIRPSRISLMVLKFIAECEKVQRESSTKDEQLEFQIASRLYKLGGGLFYFCPKCKQPYDRNRKLPNIVCYSEHLLCLQCLKKSGRFNFCEFCNEVLLKETFEKTLIIGASEFIHKRLFTQSIKFVVSDKQFSITTHPQTTIKDLFHSLQEFEHISDQLQIKLCKFYIKIPSLTQIHFREPIGTNIKKIFLEFDQQARVAGSRLTLPSKIVKELPITINSFSTSNRFSSQDIDYEGQIVKPQPSQYYQQQNSKYAKLKNDEFELKKVDMQKKKSMSKVESDRLIPIAGQLESTNLKRSQKMQFHQQSQTTCSPYPNLSHNQEKSPSSLKLKIPWQKTKKQQMSQIKNLYPSLSNAKLDLVAKSRILSHLQEQDSDKKYNQLYKQSKITKTESSPLGSQILNEFVENVNTKLPLKARPEVLNRFLEKHEVSEVDQRFLCYAVQKVMNKLYEEQELQESLRMEKQILKKAEKGDTLSLILILAKKELQDGQIKVAFTPKSTPRSQLTLKIITSHILSDRFIIRQNILQDEDYYFQKMDEDYASFDSFIKKQLKKYSNSFGLSQQSIVVHNLIKGQKVNQLVFSTNEGYIISKYLKNNVSKDITIHPYFTQLQLSPADFDKKGYIKFDQMRKKVEFRGSWPYYQPIRSVRYGIKVQGRFDKGNNKWLQMKNTAGEWAVGFHGLRNPNQAYKLYYNVILNILSSIHQPKTSKTTVVQNLNQAYSSCDCVNKKGEKVGEGVYLTPMFVQTLPYTTAQKIGDKEYHLVFQCRISPTEIRIPKQKQVYWIVRHSQAIRPYGIVLIQSKNVKNYPSAQQQFGQEFNYYKYN